MCVCTTFFLIIIPGIMDRKKSSFYHTEYIHLYIQYTGQVVNPTRSGL